MRLWLLLLLACAFAFVVAFVLLFSSFAGLVASITRAQRNCKETLRTYEKIRNRLAVPSCEVDVGEADTCCLVWGNDYSTTDPLLPKDGSSGAAS